MIISFDYAFCCMHRPTYIFQLLQKPNLDDGLICSMKNKCKTGNNTINIPEATRYVFSWNVTVCQL